MHYASFYLDFSITDKRRRGTIVSMMSNVLRDASSKVLYFSSIPDTIIALSIKCITEPPTAKEGIALTQITNLLKEMKYEEHCLDILEKCCQTEINHQISVQIEVFCSITKLLAVYNCLITCSQDASSSDIARKLLSMSNPFLRSEYNYSLESAQHESKISGAPFSSHRKYEDANKYFSTLIINVLRCCCAEMPNDSVRLKGAKWILVSSLFNNMHVSELRQLASSLPCPDALVAGEEGKVIQLIRWLFHSSFVDRDEAFRLYTCKKIGPFLLSSDFEIIRVLYADDANSSNCSDLVDKLFHEVDDLLAKHCGVMQSGYSLTGRTTHSSCTTTSTWNGDTEDISDNSSRQISSILAISSLCQHAKDDSTASKLVIKKSIMRLVRLWTVLSDTSISNNPDHYERSNYAHVAAIAFNELVKLNEMDIFPKKIIDQSEESFIPVLFAEILSGAVIEQNVYGKIDNSGAKEYKMLLKMIETFFVKKVTQLHMDSQALVQNFASIVNYVDKVLPTVITSLILAQDYETLCSCTRFRLYLLTEYNRLEKKCMSQGKEKIVGKYSKRKHLQSKSLMTSTDVKQSTSLLCRNNQSVKVLSKLLPALFMEYDKSALLFYLRTVLRCEVTLGQLVKENESKIIESIVLELGGEEKETDDDFILEPTIWLEIKSASPAVQGLKKGAIMVKHVNDDNVSLQVKHNESLQSLEDISSLNLEDAGNQCLIDAENWIHKHFMMLFIKCVMKKWQTPRLKAKVQAVKCLRVLIRFLRVSECIQYITQMMMMIDSVMSFKPSPSDPLYTESTLQLLAVRALTHFVHLLLKHRVDAVGENLCKIIVSVFPLFDIENASESNDPFSGRAMSQAINMMESLVEGENGRKLAPYFKDVPFLPKHPQLVRVRETLKRVGVDVDHPLFFSTGLTFDKMDKARASSSSATSTPGDTVSDIDGLKVVLRRRLHCFKRLFHHENDNVRKLVLEHLTSLIRGHRELFHNLVNTEDASLQFLTVHSELEDEITESTGSIIYKGERIHHYSMSLYFESIQRSLILFCDAQVIP